MSFKPEYLSGLDGDNMRRRRRSRKVANQRFSAFSHRRKPLLILTDVLKTKFGMEYMERTKKTHSAKNRGQMPSRQRESGQCREETPTYRDTRSSQREARNNRSKSVTPKRNQRTVTPTSQRWDSIVKEVM